jgi:hypothetical protein
VRQPKIAIWKFRQVFATEQVLVCIIGWEKSGARSMRFGEMSSGEDLQANEIEHGAEM